ncbi:hypothetical protein BDV95DRAFT_602083 [Massariosphaeria phaeospora]|uniref:Uncharacterized protein n=1 Tax=Massariosphaeria phaeospora TaxID=100035 RepID=A0A7C8IHF8_9PLEO|nr:hypothetical protein BDV95DRAFT_602083 [Massariosphaeria phaeospora]
MAPITRSSENTSNYSDKQTQNQYPTAIIVDAQGGLHSLDSLLEMMDPFFEQPQTHLQSLHQSHGKRTADCKKLTQTSQSKQAKTLRQELKEESQWIHFLEHIELSMTPVDAAAATQPARPDLDLPIFNVKTDCDGDFETLEQKLDFLDLCVRTNKEIIGLTVELDKGKYPPPPNETKFTEDANTGIVLELQERNAAQQAEISELKALLGEANGE